MPKFKVAVDHGIDREIAIQRLRSFSTKVREDAPVEIAEVYEEWDEEGNLQFAFAAMGLKVSGKMVTCQVKVTINGQIPFAAIPFRGQLEKQLAEKVREALVENETLG
ncbi:MAG: hypothetical protein AAFN77_01335 [Planctomycetota bacterium]